MMMKAVRIALLVFRVTPVPRIPGSITVKRNVLILAFLLFPTLLDAHWKIPSEDQTDWSVYESTHFRIHFPQGCETLAVEAAVYAEQAGAMLEQVFLHRVNRRIPVFLFASHQDFSSGNIIPIEIGENTGGFTDFYRERVVVPFSGDYASLRHVLTHEIVHAWVMDMMGRRISPRIPLWMMEGLAEYLSLTWDGDTERYIRDAVIHDRVPGLAALQSGAAGPYAPYKIGQALLLFIDATWGRQRIGHFTKEIIRVNDLRDAILSSFGMSPEEFDIEFGKFLRARYGKDMIRAAEVKDRRIRNVTFRYRSHKGYNLRPVISPDGESVAYITADKIFPAVAIRKLPGPGIEQKKVDEEKIILRALRGSSYEEYHPLTTRLSFSPDGKQILVSGRSSGKQSFLILDVKRKKVAKIITLPFDAMQYPIYSPDGTSVFFVGVVVGQADLYSFSLQTERIRRFTDDRFYESDPIVSPDGRSVYFCSNRDRARVDAPGSDLYRLEIRTRRVVRLTDLSGECKNPLPSDDGSVLFVSNHTGIANLYRLEQGDRIESAKGEESLIPITESVTGVADASLAIRTGERSAETLVFLEVEEGAREIRMLPGDESVNGRLRVGRAAPFPERSFAFSPSRYDFPGADYPLRVSPSFSDRFTSYSPFLAAEGMPLVLITGASSSEGRGIYALIGHGQFADQSGNHRLSTLFSYYSSPSVLNLDARYDYTKHRTNFFTGIYRHSGIYAIFNLFAFEFSLNDILYNPYYRLLDQDAYGVYGGIEYPFHKFSALYALVDQGREERLFRQDLPGERPQPDVLLNHTAMNVAYRFDNAVYSFFGPLDGNALLLSYSVPLKPTGSERELYSAVADWRFYHLFSNNATFALHLFAGEASGRDAEKYPFRIGGFNTIRSYEFQEFEGRSAFYMNLEYRFNLIESLRFGFPGSWDAGVVRGVFFTDAGAAFDDRRDFHPYYENGATRDLHMSIGTGIHVMNFLWFLFPGSILKIEWSSPYNLKASLPLSKWRGELSVGFNF